MYIVGQTPVALRQNCGVALAGLKPQDSTSVPIVYEPFYMEPLLTYVDPDDHTLSALAQGGLYDFGAQVVRVLGIYALAAMGNISTILADRIDVRTAGLVVGGATPAIDLVALGVVAGDKIIVTSGSITETYTVSAVNSATQVETVELITDRDLVAADVFTITSGGATLYTHTLAGVDTLDIDILTTHDVPIGTPAASRLVFDGALIVLPHQVLKVSTVSGSALGWLDVYAVKGDFY